MHGSSFVIGITVSFGITFKYFTLQPGEPASFLVPVSHKWSAVPRKFRKLVFYHMVSLVVRCIITVTSTTDIMERYMYFVTVRDEEAVNNNI